MFATEEKLFAVDLVRNGMSYRKAAKLCGVSYESIRRWRNRLDGDLSGLYSLAGNGRRKYMALDLDNLPDDPDELKRIIFDMQFEIDFKEELIGLVKKDPGVDLKRLPNKMKARLVDAIAKRRAMYSIGRMLSFVQLAPATFYYHRKREGADPQGTLRTKVIEVCHAHPAFGYRRVKHLLDAQGGSFACVSEKRVRRIMREEGIQPPRRRKHSRYSSYDARKDSGREIPNIPLKGDGTHDFKAKAPNTLWVSDVTEFLLPTGERVYLSPVLDCFDSSLLSWVISTSEKAEELTNPSLAAAAQKLREGSGCVVHTDRGGHYFSEGWIGICERCGIVRSMSRKGHSPDNARMEGFFGRLKMEFFDTVEWDDVGADEFICALDEWLRYYNEERVKESLGWSSPMEFRRRYLDVA